MNALGNNSIASALGISSGNMSPSAFATKFGTQSIFTASSLPYVIRTNKNFDVTFHWYPKRSQIRSYFANAFSASDTDELGIFIRRVTMQQLVNNPKRCDEAGGRLGGTIPGVGVGSASPTNSFSMDILSTEFSLVDHCFYQWLRETESPYWIYGPTNNSGTGGETWAGAIPSEFKTMLEEILGKYAKGLKSNSQNLDESVVKAIIGPDNSVTVANDDKTALISLQNTSDMMPFTRADVEVQYYSGNQTPLHSVIFYGAFPTRIELMSVDHNGEFKESHKVDFACDSVDIKSPFIAEAGSWASQTHDAISGFISNKLKNDKFEVGMNTAKWTAGLQEDILSNYANVWLSKASRLLNKTTNKVGGKLNDKLLNAQKSLGV